MSTNAIAEAVDERPIETTGFDAPVTSRKDDHLNRWPLARQIYSVAVDGPADWSTRIGVYGEWGTGKSSVLKFVESMAVADQHVVVWFNPWAYSTKPELWRAFVMEISSKIEPKEGENSSSGMRDWKARFGTWRDRLAGMAKDTPGDISGGVSVALESVRGLFAFSPKDVAAMREQLRGKRVIILIDDLDRTSAELVPEILYALKEIMDVPGFSFICGFDPKVVGDVLRINHPGFGDGLKFLEKIIDYPVWLPPASAEGLKKIAEADAGKYCPFIPPTALHDALDLLPKNPRSIRQFVRLCALLKTQTERHGSDELNWPIILTANVIKVRFPMLDPGTLHSQEFYGGIGMRRTYSTSTQEGEKVDQEIAAHAEKCLSESGIIDATGESKTLLQRAIRRICQHLDLWMGEGVQGVVYQSTLVERPQALTKQEFEEVMPLWKSKKSIPDVGGWMANHAEKQGLRITEVASDLVILLVDRLKNCLRAADGAFTDREKNSNRAQAKRLQSFLEEISLRPANFHADLRLRDWFPLGVVIVEMVRLVEAKSPVHQEVWTKIEPMLTRLVSSWDARFQILLDGVRDIGPHKRNSLDSPAAIVFARKLNEIVDDHLSKHVIKGIQEEEFIGRIAWQRSRTWEMRRLILNPKSQLWKMHQNDLVAALSKSKPSYAARGNAYTFLEWIKHLLENHQPHDDVAGKALASNHKLMSALWQTATSEPFLGRHAYAIREIPEKAMECGVNLTVPAWWQPAIDEFMRGLNHGSKVKQPESENSEESVQ